MYRERGEYVLPINTYHLVGKTSSDHRAHTDLIVGDTGQLGVGGNKTGCHNPCSRGSACRILYIKQEEGEYFDVNTN